MGKAAVYMRVSTDQQDCDSQRAAIEEWLRLHPQDEVRWFTDEGISGASLKRPGLQALLQATADGQFDTVVCFRLDRISRTAPVALRILLDWMQEGTQFFAVDQPIFQLGKDNPLRLTLCALLAELADLERQAIVSRVKAGLVAAKARGVKLGAETKLSPERLFALREERKHGVTFRYLARKYGISKTTAQRLCKGE